MTTRRLVSFLVLASLGLAPAIPRDIDDLIRASNAAFHQGDLSSASALLERAQRLAPDPRLVAFNLATIRYHQARAGQLTALAEAEVLYRCCIEPGDDRRSEALLGLGTCLLMRGSLGKLDALSLRASIDQFTLCRRDSRCSPETERAAIWNQQRARLLLLQAPPPIAPSAEDSTGEETNPDKPPTTHQTQPSEGNGEAHPDPTTKGDPDAKSRPTEEPAKRTGPGKGSLTPLPDQAEAPPLAATDAAAHLEGATLRISADWLRHRRGRSRAVSPGGRDW